MSREALAAADADGDGRLSLDEFAALCAARPVPAGPVRPDLLAALGPVAEGAPVSRRCCLMPARVGEFAWPASQVCPGDRIRPARATQKEYLVYM